ncbi:MAG TPA: hypothetical protein VJZ00_06590 [Thermoanaerobaculia bacterium]|nr:hypothetical protein [Thermoanaerobaculia bacterium]
MTRFAIATREELWLHGRLVERRLSHGEAIEKDGRIVARDTRDDSLLAACDAAMEHLRAHVVQDARVRLVAEASTEGVSATMTVTQHGHSIVTAPEHLDADVALLRTAGVPPAGAAASSPPPLVWKNGTGAILLHEAIGHPREHACEELVLPQWLEVDIALRQRRATFRDIPLLRMQHVKAKQTNAPFHLSEERIEILLIDGGAYEPLTDEVTIHIAAADLIEGDAKRRLAPFALTQPRRSIQFLGATGETLRYPGVICSREGQELVVGSYAPVMVTR